MILSWWMTARIWTAKTPALTSSWAMIEPASKKPRAVDSSDHGASGPGKEVMAAFGFTAQKIVEAGNAQIKKWKAS